MITSKGHRLIARVIRQAVAYNVAKLESEEVAEILHTMVEQFEKELEEDNERFDPARFRRAIFGPYTLDTI